jgi:hypothetical protein
MALACGAVVTALAYVALRVVEVVLFPSPNPVAIVSAERSALPWRLIVAAYVGGMGVLGGAAWAERDAHDAARWLGRALVLAAAAVALVGALWP